MAKNNSTKLFTKLLAMIKGNELRFVVKLDLQDGNGNSLIHNIVKPTEFGSFENIVILKEALEFGFNHELKNKQGFTAI